MEKEPENTNKTVFPELKNSQNSDGKKTDEEPKKKLSPRDRMRGFVMFSFLLILGLFIGIRRITSLVDILFLVTAVNSINQAILDFFQDKDAKAYLSAVTRGLAILVMFIAYIVSKTIN